ncbi:MAG: winged helix-turn-helix domain-containing protein [Hyphomicrobiaceae bacterium]
MTTKKKAPAKTKKATKAKPASKRSTKLSALDAAAKVLGESKEPMGCSDMVEAMAAKGYWKSTKGKTPANTLYSAILREMDAKGKESRFKKTERGKFTLA